MKIIEIITKPIIWLLKTIIKTILWIFTILIILIILYGWYYG